MAPGVFLSGLPIAEEWAMNDGGWVEEGELVALRGE